MAISILQMFNIETLSSKKTGVNVVIIVASLGFVVLFADSAWCAEAINDRDVLSEIAFKFQTKASAWAPVLQNYALALFRYLLIADVCLMGIRLALKQAELQEIFVEFIRLVLFAAFMLVVVLYFKTWANAIIGGLSAIAEGELNAPRANPGDIFWAGLKVVGAIVNEFSVLSPINSIGFVICAIAITIVFALISAQVLLVTCEIYIVLNAGTILLGFGGSKFTKDYALNFLRYALAVSVKLFVMQLLVSLAIEFVGELDGIGTEYTSLFVLIGASIVLLALTMTIPDICAGIINGSHVSTGTAITSAVTAVSTATMLAMKGMKGGASGGRSAVDAVREASQFADQAGATGAGKAGHMAKSMGAAYQASKQPSFGKKVTSNLQGQREAFSMEQEDKE